MSKGSKPAQTTTNTQQSQTQAPAFPAAIQGDMNTIANQAMALGTNNTPLPQQYVAGFGNYTLYSLATRTSFHAAHSANR